MAVGEVAALSGTIISIASTIQMFGNNYYLVDASWKEFPLKVQRLRRKHEFWQAEFTKFGMLSDAFLIHRLREAKMLLEAEEAELSNRRSKPESNCFIGCWPKLSKAVFPAQLNLHIDMAIKAFDDLQTSLTNEEEAAAALAKREQRRAFALPFRKDPRYVPLTATEKAVRDALVSEDHALVLLHGAPGKGKSTLARAIALQYEEPGDDVPFFEDVFYLECGPRAEISAVQFTLLQRLGVAFDRREEPGPDDFPKRLQGRLKDRKLLIIFDDVWDGGFLQGMVNLCGSGIKCLVTSQRADLCRGLNCSFIPIPIEDVQLQDARKILAIHVGFSDHVIPRHLEGIADEVIQEIERNPLALAIIGGSIETNRSDELDIWEAVTNDLFVKLNADSLTYMINIKYPITLWATMKRSFESLEKGARSLLILVDMCNGLSVPEEVIKLLYQGTREISTDFAKLRQELENREMVKITTVSELEVPRKERSWSIHSLQKKFIEGVVKDARESTFTSLRGLSSIETGSFTSLIGLSSIKTGSPQELVFSSLGSLGRPKMVKPFSIRGGKMVKEFSIDEEDILISLAALYFDKQFKQRATNRAALKMGIPSHNFNNLRRSAIEPVIRLLGQPISTRWTKQLRTSATRVFMGYISSNTLKDSDISDLLKSSISTQAMMIVLGDIATLGETTLLDEKLHSYMNVLIELAENGNDGEVNSNSVPSSVQKAARQALIYLCRNKACRQFIINELPQVLDTLVRPLWTDAYAPHVHGRGRSATTLAELCLPPFQHVEQPSSAPPSVERYKFIRPG